MHLEAISQRAPTQLRQISDISPSDTAGISRRAQSELGASLEPLAGVDVPQRRAVRSGQPLEMRLQSGHIELHL